MRRWCLPSLPSLTSLSHSPSPSLSLYHFPDLFLLLSAEKHAAVFSICLWQRRWNRQPYSCVWSSHCAAAPHCSTIYCSGNDSPFVKHWFRSRPGAEGPGAARLPPRRITRPLETEPEHCQQIQGETANWLFVIVKSKVIFPTSEEISAGHDATGWKMVVCGSNLYFSSARLQTHTWQIHRLNISLLPQMCALLLEVPFLRCISTPGVFLWGGHQRLSSLSSVWTDVVVFTLNLWSRGRTCECKSDFPNS